MHRPAPKSKSAPTRASSSIAVPSRFPAWLLAALLGLGTLALFWPVTRHDFVNYDDNLYVLDNPHVIRGLTWESVRWAFGNGYVSNWHPITWVSHMLDCQIFGLKPWGHHLINVLLHAVNAGLVFALLRQLTGATWRSLLVAGLFAAHPLRVESVAWVAERKDVLSAFFGLLALLYYVRYARGKTALNYGLAFFFLALGLMSKPMLVTWPFVMLLIDYWPLQRFKPHDAWQLVREKVPFFALAAMASVVTFLVQQHGGAMEATESLPLGARCGNALISYCRYLEKQFWPADLAVFYPHPGQWPVVEVLLAGGFLAGISGLLFAQRRRRPFLLMGWLWFVGTLVPVIGLVQVGEQAMADRYTYLPSLGILILGVWGAYELFRRWRYHAIALPLAGAAGIIVCMALTRQQLGHWQDSEALFRHALAVTQNNHVAHNNLGHALYQKGRNAEAIVQYQEAIRLKPDYALARNNLGIALVQQGQTDAAISQYNEAIRLAPGYAEVRYNLGIVLDQQGQTDEAIAQYQEAIRLQPDSAKARNNLGLVLAKRGQTGEAISQYQETLRLDPDYAEAHYNLGVTLGSQGQTDEAIRRYREAIRLKPDYAEARNNLGVAFGLKSQTDEAIRQFQEAIRLKPDYPDARNNLGVILGSQGRTDEAISQFQEAIRLKPDYTAARDNLARALEFKNTPTGR